tara:strand:+ start:5394 stop:6314 length:921 start_codon:yes stop_codon:yes gene_type:complete
MSVTPTPINTHYLLTELFGAYSSPKRLPKFLLQNVRPLDQSENFTINDYSQPVPLNESGLHFKRNGDSFVVILHEDGQMVNFDSYSGMDIDFYSLNITNEEDIFMHFRFAGTGTNLGSNSPIDLYYNDPANRAMEDCGSLTDQSTCSGSPSCHWDSVSLGCYCVGDTNFSGTNVNSCPGAFRGGAFDQDLIKFEVKSLPYIYFVRGDGQTKHESGNYNISSTILDDRIDEIDPANWNDWEINPYKNQRIWGMPPEEDCFIKSMAAYKMPKTYTTGWYAEETTGRMKSGLEKHMKDWKIQKQQNQTE